MSPQRAADAAWSRLGVPRKAVREAREQRALSDRLAVYGKAVVETAGARRELRVRVWDTPPGWWNHAAEDQRRAWVVQYFRRQLNLTEGDTLVSVLVQI